MLTTPMLSAALTSPDAIATQQQIMRQIFRDESTQENEPTYRKGKKVQIIDGDYTISVPGKKPPVPRGSRGRGKATTKTQESLVLNELNDVMVSTPSTRKGRVKKVLKRPKKLVQVDKLMVNEPHPQSSLSQSSSPAINLPHQFYPSSNPESNTNLDVLADVTAELAQPHENVQAEGPLAHTANLDFSAAQ